MTPDEVQVIAELIGERMEQVYATVEDLRQEVRDAVIQVRDTAQVLHDNDTVLMAKFMEVTEGALPADHVKRANESWARFVRAECEQLGWRVVVPK